MKSLNGYGKVPETPKKETTARLMTAGAMAPFFILRF